MVIDPNTLHLPDRRTHYQLKQGDCLTEMNHIQPGSIDAIIADLPFGKTKNSFDTLIDIPSMWTQFYRVLKPGGPIGMQPLSSLLVASNLANFRVEWIVKKSKPSGHLNAQHAPLRVHETVLVFVDGSHTAVYTPQLQPKAQHKIRRPVAYATSSNDGRHHTNPMRTIPTDRAYPQTIIGCSDAFHAREAGWHPHQKPIALMEYLVCTYTKPGQTVLDPTMGSGTTGVACLKLGRAFWGIERDGTHFTTAQECLANAVGGVIFTQAERRKRPYQRWLFEEGNDE